MICERLNVTMLMYNKEHLLDAKATDLVDIISMDTEKLIRFSLMIVINFVNMRLPSGKRFQLYIVGSDESKQKKWKKILDFNLDAINTKQRISQVKHIDIDDLVIDVLQPGEWSLELFMCDLYDIPEGEEDVDIRGIGEFVSSYFFEVL